MSVRRSFRMPSRTKSFQVLNQARSFDLTPVNLAAAKPGFRSSGYLPGICFPSGGPVSSKSNELFSPGFEETSNIYMFSASTSALSDGRSGDLNDLMPVQLRPLSLPHRSGLPFIPYLINQSYNNIPIQVKYFKKY